MDKLENNSFTDDTLQEMYVIKRNGNQEIVSFDKILKRVKTIGKMRDIKIQYTQLVMKVIDQLYNNIKTSQIDELTAEQCAAMSSSNPEYNKMASAIVISNLQKNTDNSFYLTAKKLYHFIDVNNQPCNLIADDIMNAVEKNRDFLESILDYSRDYNIDYFGFKTLERAYLFKVNGVIIERPQHMWLRVSLGIHGNNMEKVRETYDLMSEKYFTHATPTLFNAGTPRPQLSSCFLLAMEDDSIDGIFNTLKECAQISKWSGGIGLHVHNIRSAGSHIRGTNGTSNGLIPMLGVFNKTARYVDQGGRRNGSFAIYLEPHHPDIEAFLDLRKNHGDEEARARDLFYGLWISDLFMERVKTNAIWSLFCPDQCPDLCETYGEKYKELYLKYENEKRYVKQINSRDLWIKILDAQMETGTPYMLYKDACNKKSNQQNIGTIRSSNLCVAPETLILTDKGQLPIQDLKDQVVNVWNGKEFSETTIRQTSELSDLIEVHFNDESILTCTKYHRFYIQTKYNVSATKKDILEQSCTKIVEAQQLQEGMSIIKCDYPIIDNTEKNLEYAYTNGFFSGDGTYNNITHNEEKLCGYKCLDNEYYCKRHISYKLSDNNCINRRENNICNAVCYIKKPHVSLYGEKIKLLEYLSYVSYGNVIDKKLNVILNPNIQEKFFVPINYSLKSKLDWFAGYCDADGCIAKNGLNQSLQITSIHKEFLISIKLMLQTCGINSVIKLCYDERKTLLPTHDIQNSYNYYNCKKLWRLLIASNQLQQLLELGLNCKRLQIEKQCYQRSANHFIKVKYIIDNNRKDRTFCFNESKRHAGIFNGIITSQCVEILEYSDHKETAVCNLASISLPKFVKADKSFDYDHLHYVAGVLVNNLNNIIDVNYYPTEKTRRSNLFHRPIGIGVQGLADVFILMDLPFTSDRAKEINKMIFETIYHGAVEMSCKLAEQREILMSLLKEKTDDWSFTNGIDICQEYTVYNTECASSIETINLDCRLTEILNSVKPIKREIMRQEYLGSYSSFAGSPMSQGQFQFDLWNVKPSDRYDWSSLKEKVMRYGIRNSLLCAPMPTASTSQILGNNECFEPLTSNIYTRRTLAGEFVMVNRYLVNELMELGIWNDDIKNNIIANRGSVQYIEGLPETIREKYKIVWEMPMRDIIDMSRDRGAYICQSQSLNLWVEDPDPKILTNIHFYGWSAGLKSGMYYLRRKPKHQPQQFTIEPEKNVKEDDRGMGDCLMCSG